ncbi:hypothetical protein [Flavivirga eckloniae]|uniref:Sugar-binding protein n=1 Tax=Flavivirga eckloniae TaxID=1803846 RepID=A0A2K9PRW4_9FLAO|nr:hypothetical protein [Flavivirga eckloniae]AUP79810.1 hypothetical protein C1H87_14290 [Flavivirga eckloniae]
MKKQLITLFVLLSVGYIYAQVKVDVGTPTDSPFQLGSNIQGTIENSVNQVTGKVVFSLPIASIVASSASHSVVLTYNGQVSFKNGQQTNKYNPTSVVGVGWSMSNPKIIVDNKNTGTRDDDEFYLLDGATNTKLICTNRGTTTNGSVWEYEMEKYAPWKISFYYHNTWGDYWKIVNENGLTYYYGNPTANEARDHVIRYGNWIGSSKQNGATATQTIQWNLYKIENQWGNNLVFEYDYVTQTMSGLLQTEASYLKKIISSNGANIQLTYGTKNVDEFYEPHKEASEPDAYQERYEKKYLQSVSSYNNENQLVSTYNIGYVLNGTGLNKKRYLTSLTRIVYNNGQNETLPEQTFEYHYSGTFKGGMKKITYPTGGSVTYNYKNKFLFNNYANQYEGVPFTQPSGYIYHSSYVNDNYGLFVYRTENTIIGDKYRFKFFRVWWHGEKWEWNEFTFPHLIPDYGTVNQGGRLKDFYAVLEEDFYGFVYDKGTKADVYLWHLEKGGRTWDYYTTTNENIGSENPSFVSGDEFVALQNHRGGDLYTYVWNGSYWIYKRINQGAGQYYIAATNNYIISLDEDGGADMVTNASHEDNYYMHYLDAEKKWQTKSWSAAADPLISGIFKASYFYPDNSIIGFVADHNPELFLRWDMNYNLTNVDDVLGSYNDAHILQPVNNSMFTLIWNWAIEPKKTVRFNGLNWKVSDFISSTDFESVNFGLDMMIYKNESSDQIMYKEYSPNTNTWVSNNLNGCPWYSAFSINGINNELLIARNKIFKRTYQGPPVLPLLEIGTLQYDNGFTMSDGISHFFVKEVETIDNGGSASTTFKKGSYFYIDKNTGLLGNINLGLKYHLPSNGNKLGGYTSFMSPKSIWLKQDAGNNSFYKYFYRIIDDKLNNVIYDIVVNHIDVNDDNGSLGKVQYTYNKPKNTPDNSATFYGEVIIENKGTGVGNIGKVVKLFNDGSTDLTMVGLPMEVLAIDSNNALVKKTTTTWQKFKKYYSNGTNTIDQGYYIRPKSEKEELFFENSPKIVNSTSNTYNGYGLKTGSTTTDSNGKSVRQNIIYAYQQYSFVNDKNMLSFPYQITTRVNNVIVNVQESKWINDSGKVYIHENWSGAGPSITNLRLNSKISKVESATGNVLENNNGKGLYNAVLFGYDNLYEVATISNAKYQDVVNQLDVTYAQLQNLTATNLKTELLKLYDKLPSASINLSFYDNNGRVTSRINERQEEAFVYYDTVGREDYITDAQGNVLEKKNYHFSN